MKPTHQIDPLLAHECFYYKDGMLFNKKTRSSRALKDARAGSERPDGYRSIGLHGKSYCEHRVIYAMHHGSFDLNMEIDHINRDRADNRIENLRLATHAQNTSGRVNYKQYEPNPVLGVKIESGNRKNKFRAQIKAEGKTVHLGYFATVEEASAAYQAARKEYFGEFA